MHLAGCDAGVGRRAITGQDARSCIDHRVRADTHADHQNHPNRIAYRHGRAADTRRAAQRSNAAARDNAPSADGGAFANACSNRDSNCGAHRYARPHGDADPDQYPRPDGNGDTD